jgi:hypothetical protein
MPDKPTYESVNGKVSTEPPIDSQGLAVQTTGSFEMASLIDGTQCAK